MKHTSLLFNNTAALIMALCFKFKKKSNWVKLPLGLLKFCWNLSNHFLSNRYINRYGTVCIRVVIKCYQIVTCCHSPIRVFMYIFTYLTFILMRYLGSDRIRCNIENKRKYARGSQTFWKGFWSTGLLHPVVKNMMVAWNFNILVLNFWSIYQCNTFTLTCSFMINSFWNLMVYYQYSKNSFILLIMNM